MAGWLADEELLVVDFYNQINLLYGAITEFCSPQSCPEMKATDEYECPPFTDTTPWQKLITARFEYLWQDNENYKRPTKMPAPAYIEQLMTWVQSNIDNEQVLPSKIGRYGYVLEASYMTNMARRPVPQVIPGAGPPDLQAHVPCLRAHLLPPLPRDPRARPGAPPQHELQAVRALCGRAQPGEWEGLLGPSWGPRG